MRRIINRFGNNQNRSLKEQIVILGANDIGIHLAQTLAEDSNIILIDENEKNLKELDDKIDVLTLVANPLSEKTLRDVKVGPTSRLISVTESDNLNLLLLFLGQRLGIKEGYAVIRNQDCYQSFFPQISENDNLHIINLWELVVQRIERNNHLQIKFLGGDDERERITFAIELLKGHPLISKNKNQVIKLKKGRIKEVIKRRKIRGDSKSSLLEIGDILIIEVDRSEQEKMMRQITKSRSSNKVMVGGEGLIHPLKTHWPNYFKGMVCVEKDLAKCQQMLEVLDHALILRGDGLDIPLLKEAGIDKAESFIAASGNDEVNLLSSLLARSFGVGEIVTILKKRQHTDMLERLKLDGIISVPQLVVEHLQARLKNKRTGLESIHTYRDAKD